MDVSRSEQVPHNRQTELCDRMLDIIHAPGNEGVKAIAMVSEGDDGGIGLHGYDDEYDAVVDLLTHVRALLQSVENGSRIAVINEVGKVRFL